MARRKLGDAVRNGAAPNALMAGTVVAAPIGPDALLQVSLDAYGARLEHEAFGWSPRGDQEPAAGDRVWCRRADDGELVVVAWHPSALDTP